MAKPPSLGIFKIKAGNKQIDEHLTIKISDEKIIYTTKFLNQNNAQPIDFVLNKEGRINSFLKIQSKISPKKYNTPN